MRCAAIAVTRRICGLISRNGLKTTLGFNLCVGLRRPILEIFPIFLRLVAPARLDLEPD
jgi:hypothetical protein